MAPRKAPTIRRGALLLPLTVKNSTLFPRQHSPPPPPPSDHEDRLGELSSISVRPETKDRAGGAPPGGRQEGEGLGHCVVTVEPGLGMTLR